MRRLLLPLILATALLASCTAAPATPLAAPGGAPGSAVGAAAGGAAAGAAAGAKAVATPGGPAVLCGGGVPGTGDGGDLTLAAATGPAGGLQGLHSGPDGLLGLLYNRLFRSGDGGSTWQEVPTPKTPFGLSDAALLPGGSLLAAALDGPLYRSDDAGASWQPVAAVPRAMSILVDGQTVFVAGRLVPPGGSPLPAVYRSDDGGKSWTASSQGFWPGRADAIARDGDRLYAGVSNYDLAAHGGGLFKSSDGGRTWIQSAEGLPGWPHALWATGGNVFAQTNEGLYRSDDAAAHWQPVAGQWWYAGAGGISAFDGQVLGLEPMALATDPGSGRLLASTAGGLFQRPLAGGEWAPAGAGLPTLRLHFALPYATAGRALFRDGRFVGTLPAPNPAQVPPGALGALTLAVSPVNPDHLWALPGFESRDGGKNWQGLPAPTGPQFISGHALAVDDSTLLTQLGPRLVRSTDAGQSWSTVADWQANDLERGAGGSLWAATDRGLMRSGDGGAHWQWSGLGLPALRALAVSPDPGDPQAAVALTEGGLACTADGGTTWADATGSLPPPPYRASAALARSPRGSLYFALDNAGVWTATGAGWRALDLPAPEGLQDLAAPADDRIAVPQFWNTLYGQLPNLPPLPAQLPVVPSPSPGARWSEPALAGAGVNYLLLYANDPSVALAVGDGDTLSLTRDGGSHWAAAGKLVQGVPQTGAADIPAGLYTSSLGGSLYTAADGGRTWQVTGVKLEGSEPEMISISPDPRDPTQLLAAWENPLIMGGGSGIERSTDGGAHWSHAWVQKRLPEQPAQRVSRLLRDPTDPQRIYGAGDTLLISRDGGTTWQVAGPIQAYDVDARGVLYARVNYKPARSDNGGKSWQNLTLPAGVDPGAAVLHADPAHADRVWLWNQAPGGLWRSEDGGAHWAGVTGLPQPQVRAMAPAGPDAWYVSLNNGLLFRLELPAP